MHGGTPCRWLSMRLFVLSHRAGAPAFPCGPPKSPRGRTLCGHRTGSRSHQDRAVDRGRFLDRPGDAGRSVEVRSPEVLWAQTLQSSEPGLFDVGGSPSPTSDSSAASSRLLGTGTSTCGRPPCGRSSPFFFPLPFVAIMFSLVYYFDGPNFLPGGDQNTRPPYVPGDGTALNLCVPSGICQEKLRSVFRVHRIVSWPANQTCSVVENQAAPFSTLCCEQLMPRIDLSCLPGDAGKFEQSINVILVLYPSTYPTQKCS